jgi:hypothetical protein
VSLDGWGQVTGVETKDKVKEEAAAKEEAKADAEIAAKDPHSEEARKAKEAAEGDKAPGPSAKSSVSVAADADNVATAKSAQLTMLEALKLAHKAYPHSKTASAYLTHDGQGHVFFGINVKHKSGEFTLIYLDPATGATLGTEVGG